MSHFAEIKDGVVQRVIVAEQDFINFGYRHLITTISENSSLALVIPMIKRQMCLFLYNHSHHGH